MRISQNIMSLIERKSRVRLQETEFLAIIRSLYSAKIVMSIKTRQEVDFLKLTSVFFLKVNEWFLSKDNTQQRAGFEA